MKLLVIKPSSFGDIIHGLQAVEALKENFADKGIRLEVHWVVRDIFLDLLKCFKVVDKYLIFERNEGIAAFFRLIKEIRSEYYDFIFDYQGLFRSGLITYLARGNKKIGRSDSREFAFIFYNEVADLPNSTKSHAVEILCNFSKKIGIDTEPKRPLQFNQYDWNYSFEKKNYVALFPNSRGPEKEWPHFFELTNLLISNKINVVLVGQNPSKEFLTLKNKYLFNIFCETSISELPAIINEALCVVANDSGPIHLAAALKIPLVGLYGPTNPQNFGPFPSNDTQNIVLYDKALQSISPTSVYENIHRQISKQPIF